MEILLDILQELLKVETEEGYVKSIDNAIMLTLSDGSKYALTITKIQ